MSGDQLPMFELYGEKGPELVDFPPGVVIPSRVTDPETSHASADEIKVKAGSQRARLLVTFNDYNRNSHGYGLTDEQAMERTVGVHPTSEYSKRCSELREGGFIEPTGETRLGAAGTPRIVSRITAKGAAWIKENQ